MRLPHTALSVFAVMSAAGAAYGSFSGTAMVRADPTFNRAANTSGEVTLDGVPEFGTNGSDDVVLGVFPLEITDKTGDLATLPITGEVLGDGSPGPGPIGFCLELGQELLFEFRDYDFGDVTDSQVNDLTFGVMLTAAQETLLGELWARSFDESWITKAPGSYSLAERRAAAGFHAAVYEVVYEFDGTNLGDLGVSNGDGFFYLGTSANEVAIANAANGLLAGLTNTPDAPNTILAVLTNEFQQDVLVEVPTPGALALAGIGLAGFSLRRHRSRA